MSTKMSQGKFEMLKRLARGAAGKDQQELLAAYRRTSSEIDLQDTKVCIAVQQKLCLQSLHTVTSADAVTVQLTFCCFSHVDS